MRIEDAIDQAITKLGDSAEGRNLKAAKIALLESLGSRKNTVMKMPIVKDDYESKE